VLKQSELDAIAWHVDTRPKNPSAGIVLLNCSYLTRSITLPNTKQSLRFLVETARTYEVLKINKI
jgi:hypothetical protein